MEGMVRYCIVFVFGYWISTLVRLVHVERSLGVGAENTALDYIRTVCV